jgi:AcrR family transcriptional regulator
MNPSQTPRRTSRQKEAGEVTRRETRRRLLVAAGEVFAESGYHAATVAKIAERADVSVQTLYHAWGSKRHLLRAMFEAAVTAQDHPGNSDEPGDGAALAVYLADFAPREAGTEAAIAAIAARYRRQAERTAAAWKTYREAAAVDPEVAADWAQLNLLRRQVCRSLIARLPPDHRRVGLSADAAADLAWVIVSPDTYELLVNQGGYSLDEYETWLQAALLAALALAALAPSPDNE